MEKKDAEKKEEQTKAPTPPILPASWTAGRCERPGSTMARRPS
jgi:hypothetical protein